MSPRHPRSVTSGWSGLELRHARAPRTHRPRAPVRVALARAQVTSTRRTRPVATENKEEQERLGQSVIWNEYIYLLIQVSRGSVGSRRLSRIRALEGTSALLGGRVRDGWSQVRADPIARAVELPQSASLRPLPPAKDVKGGKQSLVSLIRSCPVPTAVRCHVPRAPRRVRLCSPLPPPSV